MAYSLTQQIAINWMLEDAVSFYDAKYWYHHGDELLDIISEDWKDPFTFGDPDPEPNLVGVFKKIVF